ncbi:MAG TPA: UDP-glucose/GDP-mannose dehydrogenase family protein [Bryobacteraceae bacterium]|nr:UDP-glucose/GDP-mannose dehydrogenase family protein [Bryobacteraceae bacterium]
MKITMIGTGYVGLTAGACFAFLGHEVTCLDADQTKIDSLRSGAIPIFEPGLAELVAQCGERLRFTCEYGEAIPGAEVVFIAVGTPPLPGGKPDLSYLCSAAASIAEHLGEAFTVIVNKSTVPIGSGNWVGSIVRDAFESRTGVRANGHFAVASNPEFLREGNALRDSLYPDRVVIGADEPKTLEVLYRLYRPLLEQTFSAPAFLPRPEELGAVPLIATDLASAELIKYAANAFLALKISYINEIAQLAERVGADIAQVAKGMGVDSRIGMQFLQAGIGWGGSCFDKDTAALIATAGEYGLRMPVVEATREVNCRQRERVVDKLLAELKILKGCTVGLLGLAFKPNTDDLRDAPALDIARRLMDRGAKVRVHDPVAMERLAREFPKLGVSVCNAPEDVARDADAVVLVTEWPQYRELEWESLAGQMRRPVLVDGRNFLDPKQMARYGFRYLGIGM